MPKPPDKSLTLKEKRALGVELMRRGATYNEAAEAVGVSKNSLAWEARAAGVKSRATDEHRNQRKAQGVQRYHNSQQYLRAGARERPDRPEPSLPKLKFLEKE